jgi:TetR/AcrR family fatty acid metabolism transcriptional regulator
MKDAIQEQLIAARRNQILDAAAIVFARQGFHPTTIKDIAREAGIADGTIYNYFENKTALLFAILDRVRDAALASADLPDLTDGDIRRFIIATLRQPLMALKGDNFALFRVLVSEVLVNDDLRVLYVEKILYPTLTGTEAAFQYWVEQGAIAPRNILLTMRVVSGMMLGLIVQFMMGDDVLESEWDTLPEFLADLLMNGLQA